MAMPDFRYATVEFINTWQYTDEKHGSMAIARLHGPDPDVMVALFAGPRHQGTYENLFATKAKFQFDVNDEAIDLHHPEIAHYWELFGDRDCSAKLVGAYSSRAIWYPVCP